MARNKKNKITETIVNHLQEIPMPEQKEVEEEVVIPEKEEEKVTVQPQKSKLFNKPVSGKTDSETTGINFGIFGVL